VYQGPNAGSRLRRRTGLAHRRSGGTRARACVFALRPFGLSAPSALAARRLPAGSTAAQRRAQHACTWRSIHAAGARRSRATGSSQRAGELTGADPANRAPLAHPRQLAGRSWPRIRRRGARFGDGLETDHLNGRPGGREATRCAVRPLRGAGDTTVYWPPWAEDPICFATTGVCAPSILYSPSGASAPGDAKTIGRGSSLCRCVEHAPS